MLPSCENGTVLLDPTQANYEFPALPYDCVFDRKDIPLLKRNIPHTIIMT
jgi:hypothetical protein